MPDLMAIVSKAIFEKEAGKSPAVGTKLAMDRYVSANKNLEPLAAGGRLFLVTVRPPDEALWLVAILDQPHFDGTQWIAAPCDTPITDISELRTRITFESGKGMSTSPGALGMSLQTPRALTADDVALIEAKLGGATFAPAPGALKAAPAPTAVSAGDPNLLARLLEAVLAAPADDLPRQVYADELVSRNDPRGEYIQVALALAGSLSIRKRELLAARRDELYGKHAETWWKAYTFDFRVHRGFIEAVNASFDEIDAVAKRLFATEPVVEVTLGECDDVEALVRASWLPRIRRLTVRHLDDESFATIVKAKGTQGLLALNVSPSELSSEGLESLGKHLPALRSLCLTGTEIGDEGLLALCGWKHLANLETLYLSQCGLSYEGVAEFLSRKFPALSKLTLSKNDLGAEISGVLVRNEDNLPALRILELKETGASHDDVEMFRDSKLARTRLDLRGNGILDSYDDLPHVRVGR